MHKYSLTDQHGFDKTKFWMGGGGGPPDAPAPPPPPPPPPAPPSKVDQDVQEEKKDALQKKKYRKGREKSILSQKGEQGSVGKKTLLGQ